MLRYDWLSDMQPTRFWPGYSRANRSLDSRITDLLQVDEVISIWSWLYCILLPTRAYLLPQHTKCIPAWIYIPRNLGRNLLVEKIQRNPTPTWLDDANDIIHTGNVSTKNFPTSRWDGTTRLWHPRHATFQPRSRGMAVEYSTCTLVPGTAFRTGFEHLPDAATSNERCWDRWHHGRSKGYCINLGGSMVDHSMIRSWHDSFDFWVSCYRKAMWKTHCVFVGRETLPEALIWITSALPIW